ncbi:MAG: tyrosine-type recombinase/integrase [Clostridia bacterium]
MNNYKETYFDKRNVSNTMRMREIMKDLPDFCYDFFVGIENQTSPLTRLNYAYDLRIFFYFLFNETNLFIGKDIYSLEVVDLEKINANHLERYVSFLSNYTISGKTCSNGERGKSRKIASVRTFFKYFFKKELLSKNVASKIDMPKIHEKSIVRLEVDEVAKIITTAEKGYNLSPREKAFNKHTALRDTALLTLLLGTGIRISECVGINIEDIDFSINGLKITRKGGNQVVLYFSDEVKKALVDYLDVRTNPIITNVSKEERSLFLSMQKKRISPRAVQFLVKKYAKVVTPLKKITPHKLRSTYGTALYRETQDIYIVADVLGHKDVNTTKKHYAAISDDIRRTASTKVRLRDLDNTGE